MRISDWSSDVCSSDLWERWFETFGVQPPARYAAVFDDSESHHRAALDGVGVALGRITRARLLLDSGQLVMLTAPRLKARYSHWLAYPPEDRQRVVTVKRGSVRDDLGVPRTITTQ